MSGSLVKRLATSPLRGLSLLMEGQALEILAPLLFQLAPQGALDKGEICEN